MIKILRILCAIYIISKNQNGNVFYINNYIDWKQFNQLHSPDLMKKGKKNAETAARKLKPTSTKATN